VYTIEDFLVFYIPKMKNFPEPFKCGLEELDFQHEEITQFLKVITEVPTLENLKTLFRFLVDHFLLEESLLKGIMEEKSAYQ
jgi:hemerythrin